MRNEILFDKKSKKTIIKMKKKIMLIRPKRTIEVHAQT